MFFKKIIVGDLGENCYIVADDNTRNAIIIDPGGDDERIKKVITENKLSPRFIVNTHGHADHIGADDKFGLPVYIHRLDAKCLADPAKNLSYLTGAPFALSISEVKILEHADIIKLDSLSLEVIHTPGHTPGGISLRLNNIVFTGDTLFFGGIGRTDFPGASEQQLLSSIRDRLLSLADETIIHPGHGPSSTIGNEKRRNPFLANA
jgi:glyoxylase-like metal-dependent hydrolase (beta-lactamase superfamily II)